MLFFYILYASLLLLLTPFLVAGKGFGGFLLFFALSMGIPVAGSILWAWLWAPGNSAANVRITIAFHVLAASLTLIWLLSAA